MHELIRAYPLASLITLGADGLCANHIPMHLSEKPQPYGLLSGHVPRSNPVWREASNGVEAIVIFQGPNAYITPSWYATKKETGKVVPTWNYTVVHAHGHIRIIDDAQWLKVHLETITNQQEASQPHPWAVSDAPSDFTEKLFGSLVGIEISISKLIGKWKVSQNRPEQDKAGVVAGLRSVGVSDASKMAGLVERGAG
jgi:transcriptional regulator